MKTSENFLGDGLEGSDSIVDARIRAWLKRTVIFDALSNLAFGAIILVAGLIVLVITFLAMVGAVWAIFQRACAIVSLSTGRSERISFDVCLWTSVVLMALLFGLNAWRAKRRSELPRIRVSDPVSPGMLPAMATLVTDLLFAGPQLVSMALRSVGTAIRLVRLNCAQGALLLSLLLSHSGRVKYSDAAAAVGSDDFVNLLAGLRYVDGIVFLTSEPQGLSLTEELRAELGGITGHKGSMFSDTPHDQTAPPPGAEETPSRYYATLGLQPSASVDEIRRAYRRLMKKNHPDLVADLGRDLAEIAEARAKEINEAYDVLVRKRS